MNIIDRGVISQPANGGAYMASITPLPDGSYIACQFVSSTFVSSDARTEILRSVDGLATWTNEGQLRGPAAAEDGWSYRGPTISVVPDGRLLMRVTRFQADRISETFDAQSESLQRPENLIYWSDDAGRTWSAPQLVTVDLDSARYTANGSGVLLQLAPDRWMYPMETWKPVGYDGPPDQKAIALFSADQGRTWGELTVVADDPTGEMNWWDHAATVLPDGRIYNMVWAHRYRAVEDLPNHCLESADQGRTWTEPRPTNLMGQMCVPIALPDGRVAAVYSYRREPQGVHVALSEDLERFDVDNKIVAFDAGAEAVLGDPEPTSLAVNMAQGFGRPGGKLLPDGTLLVYLWGTVDGLSHGRWVRISLKD